MSRWICDKEQSVTFRLILLWKSMHSFSLCGSSPLFRYRIIIYICVFHYIQETTQHYFHFIWFSPSFTNSHTFPEFYSSSPIQHTLQYKVNSIPRHFPILKCINYSPTKNRYISSSFRCETNQKLSKWYLYFEWVINISITIDWFFFQITFSSMYFNQLVLTDDHKPNPIDMFFDSQDRLNCFSYREMQSYYKTVDVGNLKRTKNSEEGNVRIHLWTRRK